ncbi:MAG: CRISPR-associated exonuclease Cas4/endonuclease Cas1 fusion [Phycisphaerae bacterium]|nr:CRISPR-associated exonuclease Cas4/endonuclease Cas1 fusion [Phycisphaerae bacterium]
MKQHLNTLFVTTPRAFLRKDGQTIAVRVQNQTKLRVPLHNLGGVVTFGAIGFSPALLGACAQAGVAVSFLTEQGRFIAATTGFTPGNVVLRREQYRRADSVAQALRIARPIVLAKIANARTVMLRAARDHPDVPGRELLDRASARLLATLDDVRRCENLEVLRGFEGDAAKSYFAAFNAMITAQSKEFVLNGRTRRPPMDRVNALLSFLYAILAHDARAACEAAGLDAAVGFLHEDRPGRPGLALDLMEELRAFLVDRLVLSLINRRQVQAPGFRVEEAGGVAMDEATRKAVLVAYQKRKQDTVEHPFLGETTTIGLLIHLQARLLARYLRGDLDAYPAFIMK